MTRSDKNRLKLITTTLNKREVSIVTLYYHEGWTQSEIATKFSISQGRVAISLQEINDKLKTVEITIPPKHRTSTMMVGRETRLPFGSEEDIYKDNGKIKIARSGDSHE